MLSLSICRASGQAILGGHSGVEHLNMLIVPLSYKHNYLEPLLAATRKFLLKEVAWARGHTEILKQVNDTAVYLERIPCWPSQIYIFLPPPASLPTSVPPSRRRCFKCFDCASLKCFGRSELAHDA